MGKAKICSRCGEGKPLGEPYRQAGGAQGQRGMCKECATKPLSAPHGRNPKVQQRRREIVERWRDEGLKI